MIKKTMVSLICVAALLGCGEQEREAPASAAKSPPEQTVDAVDPDSKSKADLPDDFYTRPSYEEEGYDPAADHEDTPDGDTGDAEFDDEPSDDLAADSNEDSDELVADINDDSVTQEEADESTSSTASDYVVTAGDNLAKIAREHNTTIVAIIAANNLSDPDKLSVGQVLKIE